MSSRGSFARNGHITNCEYTTKNITSSGVKILIGIGNNHSLPEYSHTPNSIYAKLKKDGVTLHELRFFNEKGFPVFEIAYHPESKINNGNKKDSIVHFHFFDGINRYPKAYRMDEYPEIKEKYKKYLKEFNLYDKC